MSTPSNFHLESVGSSRESFDLAMQLAMQPWRTTGATGWALVDDALLLYGFHGKNPLPFGFGGRLCADVAWAWLMQRAYPPQPNIDGSCERGFRLIAGVKLPDGVIARIECRWAEYHK